MTTLADEITMQTKIDYEKFIGVFVNKIGCHSDVDDLLSVGGKSLCHKTCEMLMRINKQRLDLSVGMHLDKDDLDMDDEDQGIIFDYAKACL